MLALSTERKHHVSTRLEDLACADGAGGAENWRRARRSPSSGASVGHLSRSRCFPNICLRGVTASSVQLRALLLSASVAPGPHPVPGLKLVSSSSSDSRVLMSNTPEPTHLNILADAAESLPLDPPCREVALHGRRQQYEDGWLRGVRL